MRDFNLRLLTNAIYYLICIECSPNSHDVCGLLFHSSSNRPISITPVTDVSLSPIFLPGSWTLIPDSRIEILFESQGSIKKIKLYTGPDGLKKGDALITYTRAEAAAMAVIQVCPLSVYLLPVCMCVCLLSVCMCVCVCLLSVNVCLCVSAVRVSVARELVCVFVCEYACRLYVCLLSVCVAVVRIRQVFYSWLDTCL